MIHHRANPVLFLRFVTVITVLHFEDPVINNKAGAMLKILQQFRKVRLL